MSSSPSPALLRRSKIFTHASYYKEILGFMADSDTFENMAHPYTIEIHRVRLKDENLIGWSVDVWHQSVSSNLDSAKQLRANAIEFLTSVLSKAYP